MDHGRLNELRKVATGMGLDVDIVFATHPSYKGATSPSYFIVAEKSVLLYSPREIGCSFDEAYSTLHTMKISGE